MSRNFGIISVGSIEDLKAKNEEEKKNSSSQLVKGRRGTAGLQISTLKLEKGKSTHFNPQDVDH